MGNRVQYILYFIIPMFLVISFQNCSSEVPFGSDEKFLKLVEGEEFPYEATFDQIAYMSCSEQENIFPDEQTFFTFRVGAYRNSGLRLSRNFLEDTEKLPTEDKVGILLRNFISSGARPQFAIRSAENFQQAFINEGSGIDGTNGVDYANIFTNLGDQSLSAHLLESLPGAYMNSWPGAPFESQARFEGTMSFYDSEVIANELRSFLSREGMLAITFSDEPGVIARGPGYLNNDERDLRRNIFGMGVQMRFKQPVPIDYQNAAGNRFLNDTPSTDMPPRLLSAIEEIRIDRANTEPLRTWSCPPTLAYRIVLRKDAIAQGCTMQPDPVNPSATLEFLRKSLFVEDWYIDVQNRCIVPKEGRERTGACYGVNSNTSQTHDIQYDFSQPCGIGPDYTGICPHFVSVCIRN